MFLFLGLISLVFRKEPSIVITIMNQMIHPYMSEIGCFPILPSLGAWILTNGLRFGITKHLGQAVRDHTLASTSSKVRVVAIGIAPWNMIHNREALLSAKVFLYQPTSGF